MVAGEGKELGGRNSRAREKKNTGEKKKHGSKDPPLPGGRN